jgi:N,N-dimethylformamidase
VTEHHFIRGYTSPLSVRPGGDVEVMVTATVPRYSAQVVRMLHADDRPGTPGLRAEHLPELGAGEHDGFIQPLATGSYVHVAATRVLDRTALTLAVWAWPTTPLRRERQTLASLRSRGGEEGFALLLTAEGLRLEFGAHTHSALVLPGPLEPRRWTRIACSVDSATGEAALAIMTPAAWPHAGRAASATGAAPVAPGSPDAPFLLAADATREGAVRTFNGKLAAPLLLARALPPSALTNAGAFAREMPLAAWDFSIGAGSTRVIDTGPHGLHGALVNMPARAVTDHEWDGRSIDHTSSASGYAAIHFHEDDLEDAAWEPAFTIRVPENARSGVYAAHLHTAEVSEHVPFFVLPPASGPRAEIALLMPTFTYQAYGNERDILDPALTRYAWVGRLHLDPAAIAPIKSLKLGPSLYDRHVDGSGCRYSSRLRPLSSLRPSELYPLLGAPRNLAADLYLIDWLEHEPAEYDVLTDDVLDADGAALLAPYRVLITGGHPEYWTAGMLDALETWLAGGGRLMYLGGNGCYWVTGVHRERPHVVEVRRGLGWRPDAGQGPGEGVLATTGEPGGLWHDRGRPPHRVLGIGFAAEGRGGQAAGYARLPASQDPRAAFIFEGVAQDEVIGEFGLVEGGAAGDEIDRFDVSLGSPSHALLLATSSGRHGEHMRLFDPHLIDQPAQLNTPAGGANPAVRADMVFYEGSSGGAVFSVGSIAWSGSLSHGGYDNNVARVTRNVLQRFLDSTPFRFPAN